MIRVLLAALSSNSMMPELTGGFYGMAEEARGRRRADFNNSHRVVCVITQRVLCSLTDCRNSIPKTRNTGCIDAGGSVSLSLEEPTAS